MGSGSTITIIDRDTYNQVGAPPLKKTSLKIFAYNAEEPVKLLGKFESTLSTGSPKRRTTEKIYFAADGYQEGVLSCLAAVTLKLIRFGTEFQTGNGIQRTKRVDKIEAGARLAEESGVPAAETPAIGNLTEEQAAGQEAMVPKGSMAENPADVPVAESSATDDPADVPATEGTVHVPVEEVAVGDLSSAGGNPIRKKKKSIPVIWPQLNLSYHLLCNFKLSLFQKKPIERGSASIPFSIFRKGKDLGWTGRVISITFQSKNLVPKKTKVKNNSRLQ